jgi:hypothetical protein
VISVPYCGKFAEYNGNELILTKTKLSLSRHVQFDDITGIKQMVNYIFYIFKVHLYGPNHPNEYRYIFQWK